VLKGDANPAADAEPYEVASAERIWFTVPKAGYALAWLSGPGGLVLGGAYALFLVSTLRRGRTASPAPAPRPLAADGEPRAAGSRRRRGKERALPTPGHRAASAAVPPGRRRVAGRRASGSVVAMALLVGAVSGGTVAWRTQPTLAAWTDLVGTSGT